ncbi:MAG: hypothetical protein WDN02_02730 [Methylovirgula sp.]|uniref:hypothetical protein n=1 Tax=Methylovirgula sp. TaxID=1978224 RepID=UPI0030767858
MRKIVPEQKAQLVTITCDRCQATYHPKEKFADEMEALEFLSCEAIGGYGSQFIGDGVRWSFDLCQKCTHDLLANTFAKSTSPMLICTES